MAFVALQSKAEDDEWVDFIPRREFQAERLKTKMTLDVTDNFQVF